MLGCGPFQAPQLGPQILGPLSIDGCSSCQALRMAVAWSLIGSLGGKDQPWTMAEGLELSPGLF